MDSENVSQVLAEHYGKVFKEHGETCKGVDWGSDPADHQLRLEKMAAVMHGSNSGEGGPSFLDVGCGFGSLYALLQDRCMLTTYHGIDLCDEMIASARVKFPKAKWSCEDILLFSDEEKYDYVVCNGIFTQKLGISISNMGDYTNEIIKKMFNVCKIGIAFNLMSTHVNFMAPNLYYRNPSETLAWCMSEITPKVRLDHSYPLYEYTVYLYRKDAQGFEYGSHRKRCVEERD